MSGPIWHVPHGNDVSYETGIGDHGLREKYVRGHVLCDHGHREKCGSEHAPSDYRLLEKRVNDRGSSDHDHHENVRGVHDRRRLCQSD